MLQTWCEVGTELVWEYVEDYKTPSIFVINQMDHQKADYDAALEQLKIDLKQSDSYSVSTKFW